MNRKVDTRKIKRIFFPERCKLCGKIIPLERENCFCYEEKIKRIGSTFCDFCGQDKEKCVCKSGDVMLSHITAPFVYKGFIKKYIQAFKFDGKKKYAHILGKEMSSRFVLSYPDVKADFVTFVPSSEKSKKERGFNQSELLAKEVSGNLGIPLEETLIKIKETENQHKIGVLKRKTNLEGAFAPSKNISVKGKTVILCDDIKTTGYTFLNCCYALFSEGAADVYCLSAAVSEYEELPF